MDVGIPHVALFPFVAFGHMNSFFRLGIALANAGVRVSYLTTPRNVVRLPEVPDHLKSRFGFVKFSMPSVVGLPDGAEATTDVSHEQFPLLFKAFDLLQEPIKRFISESVSPDWILFDFLAHWVVDVAHGVPCVLFFVSSAASLTFYGPWESLTDDGRRRWRPKPQDMTSSPKWVPFPSAVALRRYEAEAFYRVLFTGWRFADRFCKAFKGCQAIALRTCTECEADYVDLLKKLHRKADGDRKPVIPVGLLPPPPATAADNQSSSDSEMFKWLDGQAPKSVVFVSFGSETKLSVAEEQELAHGLELSGIPFLWRLARREDSLPNGFLERISGKGNGMVCFGWVPQLDILAHRSVGGSLFHSGWGSVIETLGHGHALILLPSVNDQILTARMLVEKGLAVEVQRDEEGGSFTEEGVAAALRLAMLSVSPKGEKLRSMVREMGATFADPALNAKYVKEFADFLAVNKSKPLPLPAIL